MQLTRSFLMFMSQFKDIYLNHHCHYHHHHHHHHHHHSYHDHHGHRALIMQAVVWWLPLPATILVSPLPPPYHTH
jgi:hypothetical protein